MNKSFNEWERLTELSNCGYVTDRTFCDMLDDWQEERTRMLEVMKEIISKVNKRVNGAEVIPFDEKSTFDKLREVIQQAEIFSRK